MAAISLSPNLPRNRNRFVSSHRKHPLQDRLSFASSFFPFSSAFLHKSSSSSHNQTTQTRRCVPFRVSALNNSTDSHSFDIIVIGAGIIGLTIARQLLLHSDLSVAVVDAAVPCAGATGAGQGYIWMVHKTPGTDKWELATRSRKLWEDFAESIQHQGLNPLDILGWKKTGSLLVGKTADDSVMLKRRVEQLSEAGLKAEFLSSSDLLVQEPALMLEKEGGAVFLPDDYQLDARQTVAFIQKGNRQFATKGRYREYYHEPVNGLLRSGSSGEVKAVQTSKNTLTSRKAVIFATGCWTGSLMPNLIRDATMEFAVPVKPRKLFGDVLSSYFLGNEAAKGHLLVVENFDSFKLNHGLMEAGYVNHQAATLQSSVSDSGPVHHAETTSVSMTATMDTLGNLILGSSRQLVGFSTEIDESIINRIWERAGVFFPSLREISLGNLSKSRKVKVGLRPYMPDGKPVIGPVPGLSNLFVAAGHEGEGLALALGTAEMISDMVSGNPLKVDHVPYMLQGARC